MKAGTRTTIRAGERTATPIDRFTSASETLQAGLAGSNWLDSAQSASDGFSAELDLDSLRAGDIVRVDTKNTKYLFEILDRREAMLQCSRPDRPSGRALIAACGSRCSTSFKPHHLFCGERLQFTSLDGSEPVAYRTTSITGIFLRRRS
jgi:hypothetical protein